MRTPSPHAPRAAFTLLELLIGVSLLLLLVGSLTHSLRSLRRSATYADMDGELRGQGQRAMRAILKSLKPSGFATVGGVAYPHLFLDGDAGGAYAPSAHPVPVHAALAGDPDFGPNREMVFVQPADADGDGRPDIDAAGRLVWSGDQFSYVVVTRPDGVNVLQVRTNGGTPRAVASHVERITFDDNASSGFQVPLRSIRVRIWFRKTDETGAVHRSFTESVVKLRNA